MRVKKYRNPVIILIAVIAVLTTLSIVTWCMFGTQLKAAMSIEKLDDGLYALEYRGDYGFDTYLAQGGADSDAEMADYIASFLSHGFWKQAETDPKTGEFGCSTLSVQATDGGIIFGRNYD